MSRMKLPSRLQTALAVDEHEYEFATPGAPVRGFIYVMECGPFVKIGHAKDPETRRDALQAACPYPISLLCAISGTIRNEQEIHHCLRAAGLSETGEWYRLENVASVVGQIMDGDLAESIRMAEAIMVRAKDGKG